MSWLSSQSCDLTDFEDARRAGSEHPSPSLASTTDQDIPIFDQRVFAAAVEPDASPQTAKDLMADLADCLGNGAGVFAVRSAMDPAVVGRATVAFESLLEAERQAGKAGGDHFAKPGANERLWNVQEKLAVAEPAVFCDYYANPVIALASHAWLGPGYQVTAQVNVVNPGGEAQQPHRDYHLGFMSEERAADFPAHAHGVSPMLTLQGAVAHCDMPVESGPTMLLPFSQRYEAGYVAWRRADFIEYFAEHHVQLALNKGDMVFFNPSLFHGAGTNRSADIRRVANLLQVSSAMGRAMEVVDRVAILRSIYPELLKRPAGSGAVGRIVAAAAEGYPFPADLDIEQPTGGLTPPTQAELVHKALSNQETLPSWLQ